MELWQNTSDVFHLLCLFFNPQIINKDFLKLCMKLKALYFVKQ